MKINEITLFDESTYDPSIAKIVVADEIRRALATVLMSNDFDLINNTHKFIEWCNYNTWLLNKQPCTTDNISD